MPQPLIWAEIDRAAIGHNVKELRRLIGDKVQLMVAVKANAYGHGAVEVARAALESGADQLGVARVEEGIALRRAGIEAPILILGHTPAQNAPYLMEHRLMPTIYSVDNAQAFSEVATAANKSIAFHIKVDSGMGRLGVPCDALQLDLSPNPVEEIRAILQLPGLEFQGLCTHFATADHGDKTFANRQFKRFQALAADLEADGIEIPIKHAANSGAIIDMPETHLDMVRAGISLYGLNPSDEVDLGRIDLRPALTLKARIIHLKTVPAGTRISYGGTWQPSSATTIATIPVGYGDGYNRRLSNKGQMLVNGKRAPIVGRVCMDLTMLDVGHIENVKVGDEAVLIGRQGKEEISADEIAALLGTINYEVVTALMARVERVYKTSDR